MVVGGLAMLLGTLDPLEGSVVILAKVPAGPRLRVTEGVTLNHPSFTERIDIDPSVTLSAKNFTLSPSSCAPST